MATAGLDREGGGLEIGAPLEGQGGGGGILHLKRPDRKFAVERDRASRFRQLKQPGELLFGEGQLALDVSLLGTGGLEQRAGIEQIELRNLANRLLTGRVVGQLGQIGDALRFGGKLGATDEDGVVGLTDGGDDLVGDGRDAQLGLFAAQPLALDQIRGGQAIEDHLTHLDADIIAPLRDGGALARGLVELARRPIDQGTVTLVSRSHGTDSGQHAGADLPASAFLAFHLKTRRDQLGIGLHGPIERVWQGPDGRQSGGGSNALGRTESR